MPKCKKEESGNNRYSSSSLLMFHTGRFIDMLSSSQIVTKNYTNHFMQYSRTVVRERPAILTAFLSYGGEISRDIINTTCKMSNTCNDKACAESSMTIITDLTDNNRICGVVN